jgi:two-component sensor histidine kinase
MKLDDFLIQLVKYCPCIPLDGELELRRNNGTEFTMRFTVTEKNSQASATTPQQLIE